MTDITVQNTNAFISGTDVCYDQILDKPDSRQRKYAYELSRDRRPFFAAIRVGYPYEMALQAHTWVCLSREASKYPLVYDLFLQCTDAKMERESINLPTVIEEIAQIAVADVTDYVEWDTEEITETAIDPDTLEPVEQTVKRQVIRLKDISEMPPGAGRAIKELGITSTGEVKLKLHDKMTALQTLLKKLAPDLDAKVHLHGDLNGPNSAKLLQSLERFISSTDAS